MYTGEPSELSMYAGSTALPITRTIRSISTNSLTSTGLPVSGAKPAVILPMRCAISSTERDSTTICIISLAGVSTKRSANLPPSVFTERKERLGVSDTRGIKTSDRMPSSTAFSQKAANRFCASAMRAISPVKPQSAISG